MSLDPDTVFAMANIALLSGIFLRLGALSKAHDDFSRRLDRIEKGNNHV